MLFRMLLMVSFKGHAIEMHMSHTSGSLSLKIALVIGGRMHCGALDVTTQSIDGQTSDANTRENGGNGELMRPDCVNSISVQMVTTILMTSTFATQTLNQDLSSNKKESHGLSVQLICLINAVLQFVPLMNRSVMILWKKWAIQLLTSSLTSLHRTFSALSSLDQVLQKHLHLLIVFKIEQFLN